MHSPWRGLQEVVQGAEEDLIFPKKIRASVSSSVEARSFAVR